MEGKGGGKGWRKRVEEKGGGKGGGKRWRKKSQGTKTECLFVKISQFLDYEIGYNKLI